MLKTSLEIKDGYAYITAEGSVNSANAAEFGNALAAVPEDITGVTLDIANIERGTSRRSEPEKTLREKAFSYSERKQ